MLRCELYVNNIVYKYMYIYIYIYEFILSGLIIFSDLMTGPGDMLEMPVEKAPFHSMSRTYLLDSWYNTCKKLLTFCMCHLALFALTKGLYDITGNVNLKFTSLLNQDVMVSRCTSFAIQISTILITLICIAKGVHRYTIPDKKS